MSVKIAIIGAGAIGERHAQAARETETTVSWVIDQQADRAEALAASCGAQAASDLEAVWQDDSVDAVVVGVPNWLHKPLTLQALQAGKDVLLEKPMGLNVAECDEINATAKQFNRIVQVGLVHRYSPVVQEARRLFEAGELGTVYHVKTHMYRRRGIPGLGGWFTTKAKSGGGALIDIGVHLLDIGMHLSGFQPPAEVSGQAYSVFGPRMRDYVYEDMWAGPPNYDGTCDVDDSVSAFIRCTQPLTLELNVAWAGNFSEAVLPESLVVILGDRAGLSFALFGDHLVLAKEEAGKNVEVRVDVAGPDLFAAQMQDFARAVQTREVRGASGEQAALIQSLIDGIYASSEEGRAIRLNG